MSSARRAVAAGLVIVLGLTGCTERDRGPEPARSATRLLHADGAAVEVTVLAAIPSLAPTGGRQLHVQVELRNPDESRVVQLWPYRWLGWVDAAGRQDQHPLPAHLDDGHGQRYGGGRPDFPRATRLPPGATATGFLEFLSADDAFVPHAIRFDMDDRADWPLAELPSVAVERTVPAPAGLLQPGQAAIVAGESLSGRSAADLKSVDTRLSVRISEQRDATLTAGAPRGYRGIYVTVQIRNLGRNPYDGLPTSLLAFDAAGRATIGSRVQGAAGWVDKIAPGKTVERQAGFFVVSAAPLSHVQFALDDGDSRSVAAWSFR